MKLRFTRAYSFRLKRSRAVPLPRDRTRWGLFVWTLRNRWARFLDRILGEPPPEPAVKLPVDDDFWRDHQPPNVYIPGRCLPVPLEPDDIITECQLCGCGIGGTRLGLCHLCQATFTGAAMTFRYAWGRFRDAALRPIGDFLRRLIP